MSEPRRFDPWSLFRLCLVLFVATAAFGWLFGLIETAKVLLVFKGIIPVVFVVFLLMMAGLVA